MTGPWRGPTVTPEIAQRIDRVLEQIGLFEANRDWPKVHGLCDHLAANPDQAMLYAERAFQQGRFLIAGLIGERRAKQPGARPEPMVMAWTMAALQGDDEACAYWRDRLPPALTALDEADRATLRARLSVTPGHLAQQLHSKGDRGRLLLFFDLLASLIPELHGVFASYPGSRLPPPPPRIPARRAPLMTFPGPDRPPRAARVILAGRQHWGDESSKLHEIEPRIYEGMVAYGWTVDRQLIPNIFSRQSVEQTYERIIAAHRSNPAEAIFIDHAGLGPYPLDLGLLERLRRETEGAKLVFYYLDAWQTEGWDRMRAVAPLADTIWTVFPILDLWDEPAFRDKMTYTPIPMGVDPTKLPAPGPIGDATFQGSIMWANIPRLFWLDGMAAIGSPIVLKKSDWGAKEALSAIDSYAAYLERLSATGLNLNFCLRTTGERIFTGRTIEAPFVGSLLLQERAADVDCYLVEGTHYLGFETLEELAAQIAWVRDNPDAAEKIRAEGCEYVRTEYADNRLIGHLDRVLFH